jgi:hypothetical protein
MDTAFASLRRPSRRSPMTQSADVPKDPSAQLPRNTTPTWEVELLISGIAVFAMLQLPGWLDDLVFAWRPRFDAAAGELLWLLYVYGKSAAVILAATFVIHLLLRANWIALVGLHSIHPGGIDWTRLGLGPRAREIESARSADIDAVIERADNRATTVFALGVILASFVAGIALIALVLGLLVLLALHAGMQPDFGIVWLCFAAAALGYPLARAIDQRLGARLRAGGIADRLVRRVLRFYAAIGLGASRNPGLALLSSRHGRRRIVLLIVGVTMTAVLAVTSGYKTLLDPDAFGSYALFPDAGAVPGRSIDPAHYDDRRNPARDPAVPFIQGIVVTGPYLQLVVPYDARRDDAALRLGCGPARDLGPLACLQRLRAVTLDGRPVAMPYDIGRDARTDRPALVAMVDIRGLARGRHELRIARSPVPDGPPEWDGIPFWR